MSSVLYDLPRLSLSSNTSCAWLSAYFLSYRNMTSALIMYVAMYVRNRLYYIRVFDGFQKGNANIIEAYEFN